MTYHVSCSDYNDVMERQDVFFGVTSRMQQVIAHVKIPSFNNKFDKNIYIYILLARWRHSKITFVCSEEF